MRQHLFDFICILYFKATFYYKLHTLVYTQVAKTKISANVSRQKIQHAYLGIIALLTLHIRFFNLLGDTVQDKKK